MIQPAYSATLKQPIRRYRVRQQVQDQLLIDLHSLSSVPDPSLRAGLKVTLLTESLQPAGQGILTAVDMTAQTAQIRILKQTLTPALVEVSRYWSLQVEPVQLLVSPFTVEESVQSVLSAGCRIPASHTPGLISWSLFYTAPDTDQAVEVIKGHDQATPGVCTYTHSGLWQAGTYSLIAERYDSSGIKCNQDRRSWALDTPGARLSCGNVGDILPTLYLL